MGAKSFLERGPDLSCGRGLCCFTGRRAIRTPAKAHLIAPNEALAEAIADEWRAQTDHIDPNTMPFTRMANAAIDKLGVQKKAVCDMLAAYGETDLLCYRADSPQELADRQSAAWDPVLDWCAEKMGARLEAQSGLMPFDQSPAALARLAAHVHAVRCVRIIRFA